MKKLHGFQISRFVNSIPHSSESEHHTHFTQAMVDPAEMSRPRLRTYIQKRLSLVPEASLPIRA